MNARGDDCLFPLYLQITHGASGRFTPRDIQQYGLYFLEQTHSPLSSLIPLNADIHDMPAVLSAWPGAHRHRYMDGRGRRSGQRREARYLFHLPRGACRVRPAGNSPFQFTLGNRLGFRKSPGRPSLPSVLSPFVTPRCAQAFSPVTSELPWSPGK